MQTGSRRPPRGGRRCAALPTVLVTVPRVSRSCEHFPDGCTVPSPDPLPFHTECYLQAGALSGQGPVPHRLRSIARGREALLRGRARALVFGSAQFSKDVQGLLEPLGYESASVVPGGRETSLLLQLVAAAGSGWQLFVCEVILSSPEGHAALQVAREVRKASPLTFIAVCGAGGAENAGVRLACFEIGANMVTRCRESLRCVAVVVGSHGQSGGRLRCVTCGMADLTEDELWEHYPTFHINHPLVATQCPVPSQSLNPRLDPTP